ncbi:MAG TPA: hypothetical protein PK280_10310 [Planctomycetota bacterium]|nr:hypothetical protein [Planctomycetota bacterium]
MLAYALWLPGLDVTDGRHDLGHNGIWIQHGWLGDDAWFERNGKAARRTEFRSRESVEALADRLRRHGITDVFPHLCPCTSDGSLPPVDPEQTKRFLAAFAGFRVMPWVGGVSGETADVESDAWRAGFSRSARKLLEEHPGFAGIHVNIEPCPPGSPGFLKLLEVLKASLPPGKVLSVAAYPPPTVWHGFPEVHWTKTYFRQVAARSDQLAVMMYDTSLRNEKLYRHLMARWTREVLAWSGGTEVLLGLPAYGDADSGYHHPEAENLSNALLGVHAGLGSPAEMPANYRGVAIYCEWEMDESEWAWYRERFLKH